jgi:hypothetical protein
LSPAFEKRLIAAIVKGEPTQITSCSADDKVEKEYLSRMRRDRKENNSGGEKLPPNELEATCKREAGLK